MHGDVEPCRTLDTLGRGEPQTIREISKELCGGGGVDLARAKFGMAKPGANNMLLSSAVHLEERLTNQAINQLVRQAVSQTVSWASKQTMTQSLGFFSGRLAYQ